MGLYGQPCWVTGKSVTLNDQKLETAICMCEEPPGEVRESFIYAGQLYADTEVLRPPLQGVMVDSSQASCRPPRGEYMQEGSRVGIRHPPPVAKA